MTNKIHQKEKKSLSASGLLNLVSKIFSQIQPAKRHKSNRKISLKDCLMSGLAMFSLKCPSLLSFDLLRNKDCIRHNLKTLYGIQNTPCDTYMREQLDEIDPKELRPAFLAVFKEAQRGKLLEQYRFIDDEYLLLTDGTGVFSSDRVHCKNCCQKNHRDGRVTFHHQLLSGVLAHPDIAQVIPLCPESITKQDGEKKNDCERRALQRFLSDLKKEHPRLKATIVSDALSATAPHINNLKSLGYGFIVNVKKSSNISLYNWLKNVELEQTTVRVGKNVYHFRYINGVPLNDTKESPEVNFYECSAVEIVGRKEVKKEFSWVTNHKITKDNIYLLLRGGRSRWKIENETFNTLKNQGYQFEHNFGHGKNNLHTVFCFLMMLAFLIDQLQEKACGLFQAALKTSVTRRALWENLRGYFHLYLVESWVDLFTAIGREIVSVLSFDTS